MQAAPHPQVSSATSWFLVVATGVLLAGVGLVFPLLAEIQDTFGFSTASLGLISAAAFGSALVSGLFFSGLADRGHTRALLVGGAVLCGVSVLWFAAGTEVWQFVGARVLEGLGLGIFTPAVRKVMTAGASGDAGHQLGRLVSAELGGLLVGPLVGTALASAFSLDAPFVVLGVLNLVLAGVLAWWPLPEVEPSVTRQSPLTASLRLLKVPAAAGTALLSLALFLPVGIYDSLWARYLSDRGASTLFIGVTLSLYSLPIVLVAPFGGRLADRTGPVRAATIAMCVIVPVTVLYGSVPWPVAIAAFAILESFPQAVASPAVQTAMLRVGGEGDVAAGQGLINSLNMLGGTVVGLLAPLGYAALGPSVLFALAGAAMAGVFGAGLLLLRRGNGQNSPADTAGVRVVP